MLEAYRKVVLRARLMGVKGRVQKEGLLFHVNARGRTGDRYSPWLSVVWVNWRTRGDHLPERSGRRPLPHLNCLLEFG